MSYFPRNAKRTPAPAFALHEVITAVHAVTNGFTLAYVPATKATAQNPATSSLAQALLSGPRDGAWASAVNASAGVQNEVHELLSALVLEPCRSEFDGSVHLALRDFNRIVSVGTVAWAICNVTKPKAPAKVITGTNEHVGAVGERLTLTLTLKSSKLIQGGYGNSYLYNFEDAEGRAFKSFSTSGVSQPNRYRNGWSHLNSIGPSCPLTEGETYIIKGTVKAHDVWQGKKATTLTRIKWD